MNTRSITFLLLSAVLIHTVACQSYIGRGGLVGRRGGRLSSLGLGSSDYVDPYDPIDPYYDPLDGISTRRVIGGRRGILGGGRSVLGGGRSILGGRRSVLGGRRGILGGRRRGIGGRLGRRQSFIEDPFMDSVHGVRRTSVVRDTFLPVNTGY